MVFKKGFTLVELIIVIGLIGLLTVIGSFGYVNYSERSRDARRRIDVQALRSALELYRSNTVEGVYPTTNEYGSGTNSVLVTRGLLQSIPLDPRGAAYQYSPLPAGCNNTSSFCTSYTITIGLESSGTNYVVNPASIN